MKTGLPVAAALALALSGCSLRQPAVEIRDFALHVSPAPAAAPGRMSVSVLPFTAAPEAPGRMLLYRVDNVRYEHDFYNRLLAPPSRLLTDGLRTWLSRSGAAVVREPGAPLDADFIVRGRLDRMYADYRDTRNPRAVLALTIVLIRRDPAGNRQVFQRTYRESAAMERISPEALVEAWSRGAARAFSRFTEDFRRATAG
jgi:ABC-type uncharacterized transport system auxiliary subunit